MILSRQEMEVIVKKFLDEIYVRQTHAGQITLHFSQGGQFERFEQNQVIKPPPNRPCRKPM